MNSKFCLFIAVLSFCVILAFAAAAQADSIQFNLGGGGSVSVGGNINGQLTFETPSGQGISANNFEGSATPKNSGTPTSFSTVYPTYGSNNMLNFNAGNGTYNNNGYGSWSFASGNFTITTSNGGGGSVNVVSGGSFSSSDPLTITGYSGSYETINWSGTSDALDSTIANYFGVETNGSSASGNLSLYQDTTSNGGMDFTSSGSDILSGTRTVETASASEAASLWILGVGLFSVVLAGRQYL